MILVLRSATVSWISASSSLPEKKRWFRQHEALDNLHGHSEFCFVTRLAWKIRMPSAPARSHV